MTPTPEDITALYGPGVRYVPAWQVTLGTLVVQCRAEGRAAAHSSPVVSVGNNNRIVVYWCKNGLGQELHEDSLVLVEDGK